MTGVNIACFAQAGGRLRPEFAASRGLRSKRILNLPAGEGDGPKAHASLPERTFSAPSCTPQEIICVSSPDDVRKVGPLFFKRLMSCLGRGQSIRVNGGRALSPLGKY